MFMNMDPTRWEIARWVTLRVGELEKVSEPIQKETIDHIRGRKWEKWNTLYSDEDSVPSHWTRQGVKASWGILRAENRMSWWAWGGFGSPENMPCRPPAAGFSCLRPQCCALKSSIMFAAGQWSMSQWAVPTPRRSAAGYAGQQVPERPRHLGQGFWPENNNLAKPL